MGGAVAALARVSVALLHERPALSVGEHRPERMVASCPRSTPRRRRRGATAPRRKFANLSSLSSPISQGAPPRLPSGARRPSWFYHFSCVYCRLTSVDCDVRHKRSRGRSS